jgi:NADPH2:quinone reductase
MGERVWIWNGQWRRAHGTAAEYIVLPAAQAMSLPDGTTYEEGACLGIPALTALQALRLADTAPGMTVLVVGGAGSVGHYIVQLARQRGARVIATVSSGAKAEHARAGGADVIIDYRTEDLPARIAEITNGLGVDIVFELDIAMNAAAYPLLVRPHGKIIVYGTSTDRATIPALWLLRHAVPVLPFLVYDVSTADRRAGLEQLNALLRTAALTHTIAAAMPLERIADAHRLGESGKAIGNIVLAVGP